MKSIVFVAIWFLLPVSAFADEQLFIRQMGEPLRGGPGGPLIGTLNKNVPVKKSEVRTDWVKITVEGWVRVDALSAGKQAQTGTTSTTAGEPLAVAGFEMRKVSKQETGTTAVVQLKVKVKNVSSQAIKGWGGLLVVQNSKDEVILRTTVSGSDKTIAPSAVEEYSFLWRDTETEYEDLASLAPETIKVSLHKINFQ